MSGDTGRRGWRPEDWLDGYGSLDPDGRFLDAQRAGIEAAASIVERMAAGWASALHGDRSDSDGRNGDAGHDGATGAGASGDSGDSAAGDDDEGERDAGDRNTDDPAGERDPFRDLRVEAVRSLDAAMDLTRRVVESSLDLADAALRRPHVATWATTDGTDRGAAVVEVRAPVGGNGHAEAWLHHLGDPAGPITWHVLGPSNGAAPVASVRVEPETIGSLHDGERIELRVAIDVADDTAPGTYHGLVLAAGAEETALVLRLVVTAAGSR